jgi:hypothetical protein
MANTPSSLDPNCLEFVERILNPTVKVNLERLNVAHLDERSLLYLITALLLEARLHRQTEIKVQPPGSFSTAQRFYSFTALTSAFGLAILAFSGLSLALYIGFSLAHSSSSQPQIKPQYEQSLGNSIVKLNGEL